MGELRVRPAVVADHDVIARMLKASWGTTTVAIHGTVYDASCLPALLAEQDGRAVGLLTYTIADRALEIVSLDAVVRGTGVGSALLDAVTNVAREAGARRIWLVTTNDNLDALRFYQRRGMRITGVTSGAVDAARALKPSLPVTGNYGIELHDELTLESTL
jgi:GNAT superfamily N-acetyltransferase